MELELQPHDVAMIDGILLAVGKPELASKLRQFAEIYMADPIPAATDVVVKNEGANPPGPRFL